jgi:hypothetical protein
MRQLSGSRASRPWLLILCLLLVVQSLLPLRPDAPKTALAADADIDHCTDWPAASLKAPGVTQDDDITTYRVSASFKTFNPLLPYIDGPFAEAPIGPGWRVLIRPDQPFALFFN